MQAELETGDDSEVSAAAPNAPVEVRILAGVCPEVTAVRRYYVDGAQVVDREAKAPREAAKTAAQRQTADAGMRHGSRRGHETERHRLVINLPEQAAALHVGDSRRGIDPHAAHAERSTSRPPSQVDLPP